MAIHQRLSWKTMDGLAVMAQVWKPTVPLKAAICLVHGMGEHSTRYAHVAQYLAQFGIGMLGFDHRGHGETQGKRGHSPNYSSLMKDVTLALAETTKQFPNIPIFLYGHSMGGNLVLNHALTQNPHIKGVIASAPWLRLAFEPSKLDMFLAKTVVNIFPSFTQNSKLDATAISRDKGVVAAYMADKWVHAMISPAMFLGCKNAGDYALEHASEFAYPLLIFHGSADRLTSHDATQAFAEKVKGDVTWKSLTGYFHEAHNEPEPERQMVLEMVKDWVFNHI